MKKIITYWGIAFWLLGVANVNADEITLRADSWCPYNCDPTSDQLGFLIDIAKAVFEEHGHKIDYKLMNWARAIEDVGSGAAVGLVGAGANDAPDFIFPKEEQALQTMCFFVRPDSTWTYTGPDSLKSIKLAVIKDYSYDSKLDPYIEANQSKLERLSGENATEKAIKMLIAERVQAYVDDPMVINQMLEELGQKDSVKVAGCSVAEPVYIAFSPANPKSKEYAEMLSQGIQKLRQTGKLSEILKKYGSKDWK